MTELTPAPDAGRRVPAATIDPSPRFRPRRRTSAETAPGFRPRSPRSLRILIGLAVIVAGYAVFVAWTANRARQDLTAGRSLLDRAKGMTSDADLQNATAVAPLRSGAAHLDSAHRKLEEAAIEPLQYLPFVGRQLRSASALALAGSRSANTVAVALTGARDLATTPPDPNGRVALLRQFQTLVTTARLRLNDVGLGPRNGLLGTLARTRNDLASELTKAKSALDHAVAASNAAIDLLNGHHTVLLLLTNNAEMRAGSGMANRLAVLHLDDGRTTVDSSVRVADVPVPAGAVTGPADFTARWGWLQPTTDWQELLASPRFDTTAALAARMWQASGHPAVDAVMAVDPFALQAILGATGPVTFGGRRIDGSNVVDELLHQQYEQYPDQLEAARHEELGALTQLSIARLDQGGWSASSLALDIANAVRGRHIMIWAADPGDEEAWLGAGATGGVGPDSLLISMLNRGRDKGDYYLYTNAAIETRVGPAGTDLTVTMAINNRAPVNDLGYVIGPGLGVQSVLRPGQTVDAGDYVGVLAITLPADATNVQIAGDPAPAVLGPDGQSVVIGDQYVIRRGTTMLAIVRFHLPAGLRRLHLEAAARSPNLYWRMAKNKFVPADSGRTFSW